VVVAISVLEFFLAAMFFALGWEATAGITLSMALWMLAHAVPSRE
jgi:hypothetical protein